MIDYVAPSIPRSSVGTEGREADGDDQCIRGNVRGGSKADPERPGRQDDQNDGSEWGECEKSVSR